jgi:hypothetical protein
MICILLATLSTIDIEGLEKSRNGTGPEAENSPNRGKRLLHPANRSGFGQYSRVRANSFSSSEAPLIGANSGNLEKLSKFLQTKVLGHRTGPFKMTVSEES